MGFRAENPTFAAGVVSPHIEARIDVGKRSTACRQARNVMVRPEGGLMSRPGFGFVGELKDSAKLGRLRPFEFSPDQSYALVFSQATMRPAALGGFVLNELLTITGITNDTAGVVEAAFHAYEVGDQLYIAGIQGMTEINNRTVTVTAVVDADHFEINVNTTAFGAFTADTGGVTRVAPPDATPGAPDVDPPVDPARPPHVTLPPGAEVP
jgi:hypothetical protein